jgi:RNA polymerase sigma-B factor
VTVTDNARNKEYQEFAPLFHELADHSASERRRLRIRDRLVTEHLPVAEHIARKFRNRGQPEEDLRQVAMVGLINAVDRFDPSRGSDFLSFAVPTITGEVRRYFRDATWAIRVPRRLKELHAAISAASARLGQELGRSPRPSELAAELRIPVTEVYEGLQVGFAYNSDSLDESADDDGQGKVSSQLGRIDGALALVEDRAALYPALSRLPEREASIVVMRFFGNMTQTQIAERIGVSQMHVSRLLATSLRTLRDVLAENAGAGSADGSTRAAE